MLSREVHVLCSRPNEHQAEMAAACRELTSELPALLARECHIPKPYTEVCNCGANRKDIHVHVSGLNTICTVAEQPRKAVLQFIESTVKRSFIGIAIDVMVIDDDDLADRRLEPSAHYGHAHGVQALPLH